MGTLNDHLNRLSVERDAGLRGLHIDQSLPGNRLAYRERVLLGSCRSLECFAQDRPRESPLYVIQPDAALFPVLPANRAAAIF